MRSMCCRPTTRRGTRCARGASADAGRLRIRVADVASEADWRALAVEIEREGAPLYGLVNNAGVTLRKTVTETSHAEWRRLLTSIWTDRSWRYTRLPA